jgi:hypothetical protein
MPCRICVPYACIHPSTMPFWWILSPRVFHTDSLPCWIVFIGQTTKHCGDLHPLYTLHTLELRDHPVLCSCEPRVFRVHQQATEGIIPHRQLGVYVGL